MRRWGALGLMLFVAACASHAPPRPTVGTVEDGGGLSCVPYARMRSGIALRGDAWQWWDAADGYYPRDTRPRPGGVLVLMRSSRLPHGHVSVVSRVISDREIRVDHANWATGSARGRVAHDQPVVDVSAANDWSVVRVWYPPAQDYGATSYAANGFVLPLTVTAAR